MVGGMGVVYFCLDHGNNYHPVDLKTFKPEYLPDRAARDRFLREGTIWVELDHHPNIVRCHEVEYFPPIAFIVMELIAKEQGREDASLRSWLGAPMPVDQALLFALQIARGMKHASEKIPGFVHRDLKPENVLVGADKLPGTDINRLRVTDFGLAAILQSSEPVSGIKEKSSLDEHQSPLAESSAVGSRTQLTHGMVGTPLYMAPEQWQGEPLGVYTDIYALGCILFEMLSGQRAAGGKTIKELQAAHFFGNLLPLPLGWPHEVRELLTKSLSLRPQARFQSWDEFTRALEQAYAAQGLGSAPPSDTLPDESLEERQQAGWSYNAMGQAYLDMGKSEVAVEYYQKALALAREIGDRRGEGNALGNLGNAYAALGNPRQAIQFYEQDLVIAREIGDRLGEGNALGGLGNAYAILGDPRRAITFYEKSLVIHREIDHLNGVALDYLNMALLYQQQGDRAHALPLAQEAAQAFSRIGHPEYTQRAQQLIAQLQGGGTDPVSEAKAAQDPFEAFLRADTPQAMLSAVALHPLFTDAQFIQALAKFINEQVQPEQKPAFEQRLHWLRQIAGNEE